MSVEQPLITTKTDRITVIDGLRGFAIAAILLIHCSNNFTWDVPTLAKYGLDVSMLWASPEWLQSLNGWIRTTLYFVFENKAFTIFALLFGFTYALQAQSRIKRNVPFMGRMYWRMLILLGFGVLNSAFFIGGDQLFSYGLAMMLILPLIKLSNRTLLILASIVLIQPLQIINYFTPFYAGWTSTYYVAVFDHNLSGDFLQSLVANVRYGLMASFSWGFEGGRFEQTLGLFMVGIVMCRSRFFTYSSTFFCKLALVALTCSILLYYIKNDAVFVGWGIYYNLMACTALICVIVLLYRWRSESFIWRKLRIYGRMSLTNYIGHSVICSILFYPWGLNGAAYLGVTLSVLVGVIVLMGQIMISEWWLKNHKRGPLEELWHKLTWFKLN